MQLLSKFRSSSKCDFRSNSTKRIRSKYRWSSFQLSPPNFKSIYLYIYKIVAILFLWTQTPPTILVIEGWNLGTNPPIVGGRPLTNFFEIGPRVPRLGPNLGQNLNKIAITREPLGRFGWNLNWRDIFKLYYHLNSMVKALMSTGIEIMVAQNT